jgi:hypothetical protein
MAQTGLENKRMCVQCLYRFVLTVASVFVVTGSAQTTDTQPSHLKTVWVIVMENQNWATIKGSKSAPYINETLLPMASHAEQYFNPPNVHPSLPNYVTSIQVCPITFGSRPEPISEFVTTSHPSLTASLRASI